MTNPDCGGQPSTSVAANSSSQDSQITRSYVWSTNNSAASNLVSESIASVDGATTWNAAFGLTNKRPTWIGITGNVTCHLTSAPEGSTTRLVSREIV